MKIQTLLFSLLVGLTGCTAITHSGSIIVVKTRFFGISAGQNPATQTPEVKLGWGSIVYQIVPVSTNGPVYAPRYVDAFNIGQALNPFATKIIENTAIGDTAVGSEGTGGAVIPKLEKPHPTSQPATNSVPVKAFIPLHSPKDSN